MRILLLSLLFPILVQAQDPKLGHPENYRNHMNPALTSSNSDWFRAAYRNQWPQISGNYVTTFVGYFHRLDNWNANLGLSYSHDQAAQTLTTQNIGLTYSQEFTAGPGAIVGGIELAYRTKKLDWNQLTFGDMVDPRRGFVYQTSTTPVGGTANYFNASVGAMYTIEKRLKVGYAAHHINRPNESVINGDSPLPIRHTVHLKYNWLVGENWGFRPYFNAHVQDNFSCYQTGVLGVFDQFVSAGIGLRSGFSNSDGTAFMGTLGVYLKRFRISYLHQIESGAGLDGLRTHEIGLDFNVDWKKRGDRSALEF